MTAPGIVDLMERAAAGPGAIRFVPSNVQLTIREMWDESAGVARWLTARAGRGGRVGAFLSNTPACPAVVFGTWRSDNALVSLPYPGRGADLTTYASQIAAMCELAEVEVVLVDEAYQAWLPPLPVKVASFQEAIRGDGPHCDLDGQGGLIQFTSGSLGRPKGVVLTPQALASNITAILETVDAQRGDVACSWLPLSHDMGFVGMFLTSLATSDPATGGALLILQTPESFLADPTSWIRHCSQERATFTTAPNFAFELAVRARRFLPDADLSSLRVCITGAERVEAPTLRRFAEAYADAGLNPAVICPAYGMAEAALAVTMVRPSETWRELSLDRQALAAGLVRPPQPGDGAGRGEAVSYVSNGPVVPGMEVRVRAEPGQDVGEVQVRGHSMLSSYLGADLRLTDDGWLPTRDLGFLDDGELFLVGRSDETIIVGGQNHYAGDIEHAVSHELVRPGCLAAVPLDEGFALLAEPRGEPDGDALRAACRELATATVRATGIRPRLVGFLPRGSLLKTPSGKTQRVPLARAVQGGSLDLIASLSLDGRRSTTDGGPS